MANEINVPQLILVLLLSGVAIRYFFFSSPTPATQRRVSSASAARAREADVERIQQMFPQIPRRHIMWNLQRDGGNVAATTERVLSGRGLEVVSWISVYRSYQVSGTSRALRAGIIMLVGTLC